MCPIKGKHHCFLLLVIINQAKWITGDSSGLRLSASGRLSSIFPGHRSLLQWPNWLTMDAVYDLFFSGFRFLIFKMVDFRMASGFKICASSDWLVMSVWNHQWKSHHIHVYWEEVSWLISDVTHVSWAVGGWSVFAHFSWWSLGGTKIQSVCEFLTWHIYVSAFVLWVLQSGAQGREWILLIFIFSGPSEEEGPEGSGGRTIDSVVRKTWSPIPELLSPSCECLCSSNHRCCLPSILEHPFGGN